MVSDAPFKTPRVSSNVTPKPASLNDRHGSPSPSAPPPTTDLSLFRAALFSPTLEEDNSPGIAVDDVAPCALSLLTYHSTTPRQPPQSQPNPPPLYLPSRFDETRTSYHSTLPPSPSSIALPLCCVCLHLCLPTHRLERLEFNSTNERTNEEGMRNIKGEHRSQRRRIGSLSHKEWSRRCCARVRRTTG